MLLEHGLLQLLNGELESILVFTLLLQLLCSFLRSLDSLKLLLEKSLHFSSQIQVLPSQFFVYRLKFRQLFLFQRGVVKGGFDLALLALLLEDMKLVLERINFFLESVPSEI